MNHISKRLRFLALPLLLLGAGCTHNHYYGAAPMAGTGTMQARAGTTPVMAGTQPMMAGTTPMFASNYCDQQGNAGTPVIVQTLPGQSNAVAINTRPPTIITSQPSGGTGGWKNRRDSSGATTRISGTLDESSVAR